MNGNYIIRAFYSAYKWQTTQQERETTMERTIYKEERAYWKAVFKQERKRKAKKALTYICAFFLFTMPVWMFLDYIAKGY